MSRVLRVTRRSSEDIALVQDRETVTLSGEALAFARLANVLGMTSDNSPTDSSTKLELVILGSKDNSIAVAVDKVLYEEEILVKNFSSPLTHVRNFSGATVLASGDVVPIINVSDLLKSARRSVQPVPKVVPESARSDKPITRKRILLAEDSITSRMLLKGILESAGFIVETAVDGMDALTTLRSESFDLLVSDVEMPRMNGFDLTARIRADNKFANLPVVLVTALASQADRERGIDVGANAYIIKSNFDQGTLLDVVNRFL